MPLIYDPLVELIAPELYTSTIPTLSRSELIAGLLNYPNEYARSRRVPNANANTSVLPLSTMPQGEEIFSDYRLGPLKDIQDYRTFDPEGRNRTSRNTAGVQARITRDLPLPKGVFRNAAAEFYFYRDQSRVIECLKRKRRREVMHALGKSGKKGQRRPHRGPRSSIYCGDIIPEGI